MRGIAMAIIGLTMILNMRLGRLDPDENIRKMWASPYPFYVNSTWLIATLYNIIQGW